MNRSKAPLALMGQLLVVLFFAISAAICLQAFAKSELISEESEKRDHASRACQNVAETLISTNGDLSLTATIVGGNTSESALVLYFDKNWNITDDGAYKLTAEKVSSVEEGIGKGRIIVTEKDGKEALFSLNCAWQEGLE